LRAERFPRRSALSRPRSTTADGAARPLRPPLPLQLAAIASTLSIVSIICFVDTITRPASVDHYPTCVLISPGGLHRTRTKKGRRPQRRLLVTHATRSSVPAQPKAIVHVRVRFRLTVALVGVLRIRNVTEFVIGASKKLARNRRSGLLGAKYPEVYFLRGGDAQFQHSPCRAEYP